MTSKKKLALVWHIKPANFCAVIAIAKLSSCHSFYIVVVCKKRARGLPCLVSSLWLHKKPLRKLIRAASQQRCVGSAKWLHEMVFCTRKIKGGVEHRDNTGLISSILSIFWKFCRRSFCQKTVQKSFGVIFLLFLFCSLGQLYTLVSGLVYLKEDLPLLKPFQPLAERGSWFWCWL